jgi:transposase
VVLLLDENPSHTAKASQQLAEELQIELLWLPKRAPELNPMEKLWGQGKGIISANLQYPTIDDHLQALIQYLECLTNWEARYTAGILSQEFWLKSVL